MSGQKMADPAPENIDGSKVVSYSHEIHHSINWGYVALGIGVFVAALVIHQKVSGGGSDGQENVVP